MIMMIVFIEKIYTMPSRYGSPGPKCFTRSTEGETEAIFTKFLEAWI